jgi:hypothetical protein
VDGGAGYPSALDTLRLDGTVQRGEARNHAKSFVGAFKHRIRRMKRRPGSWHTLGSIWPLLDALGWAWNEQVADA